ncbi:MAG TPA: hypothetical protein VGG78_05410 [Gemmatimonadaceae bacterium]
MILISSRRHAPLIGAALMLCAPSAFAQRSSHRRHATRCDTIATTSIAFGRTAGNIMPSGLIVATNGVVRPLADSASEAPGVHTMPVAELRRIAARAWRGPFVRLPTAPTRPTHNPDVARDYVELRSACGRKHVEVPADQEPASFKEIFTQLQTAAGGRP